MEKSEPKRVAPPTTRPPASAPATASPGGSAGRAPAPAATARPWLLRKRGQSEVLHCPDLVTLRLWMLERRVSRDDEVSRGGKIFRRLGNIVEFESLFYSVDVERAQRRQSTGQMPIPSLSTPSIPPRGEAPPVEKLHVTLPGLTPNSGSMSPLRITPSGQPARPRPPQPPTAAGSAAPGAAAAGPRPSGPTVATIREPTGAMPIPKDLIDLPPPATQPRKLPGTPALPGAPRKEVSAVMPAPTPAQQAPRKEAVAAPPVPPAAPRKEAVAPPPVPTPVPEAVPQLRDGDDEGMPTTRYSKIPAGNQTAPVERKAPEPEPKAQSQLEPKPEKRLEKTTEPQEVKTPPKTSLQSSQKTEPVPVVIPDPIERALLKSDPVPRHLKEAADPDRTLRISTKDDHTERFERTEGRRGLMLFVVSVGITCVLVFALQQASKPENPKPSESTPSGPGPAPTSGTNEPATQTPTTPPQPETPPTVPPTTATQPETPPSVPPATTPTPPVAQAKPTPTPPVAQAKPTPTPPVAQAKPTPTPPVAQVKPTPTTSGRKLVVTEIPKTFDEQMELAQRLVEREQFDEAQRLFETILGYASHVPAVHVGLGKCALEQGRTTEAIQHYQEALNRLSTYGPAIFGLAKAYRQKGDKEQAITYYKKYLELNPTGSAASVAREAIARLEGQPLPKPASELVKPPEKPQQEKPDSELIKPQ